MKCPNCGKSCEFHKNSPWDAWLDRGYGSQCRVRAICCGALIRIGSVTKFVCHGVDKRDDEVDDWGN